MAQALHAESTTKCRNDTTRADGSIRTRSEGAVRVLTIDRPDQKNAFSLVMYASLYD